MTTRNTTMNCWGTSEQRRVEMMNQQWKYFESDLGWNIWLMHRQDRRMITDRWEWINLNWWTPDNKLGGLLNYFGWVKRILTIQKQLWEDGNKLEWRMLKRTDKIWRENSSSVFKIWEWRRETPPWNVEILRNDEFKGWANGDKNLTDLGERH